MAITLITPPTGGAPLTNTDYDAQNLVLTNLINGGFNKNWLTNWDNTSKPDIINGAVIPHGGALFLANGNESISGTPTDGRNYIKLSVSGNTLLASFTTSTIGVSWNPVYHGFYDGNGDQWIPYIVIVNNSGTTFRKINFFLANPVNVHDINSIVTYVENGIIGPWNMFTGSASYFIPKPAPYANPITYGETVDVIVRNDAGTIYTKFEGIAGANPTISFESNDIRLIAEGTYITGNYQSLAIDRGRYRVTYRL